MPEFTTSSGRSPTELEWEDWAIKDDSLGVGFDELAGLAARICQTSTAMIHLFDGDRQEPFASVGMELEAGPMMQSLCRKIFAEADDVKQVEDVRNDSRFADFVRLKTANGMQFYAGAPMLTKNGAVLGGICVMDTVSRRLEPEQIEFLRTLSNQVVMQLELRRQNLELRELKQASDLTLEALQSSEERYRLAMSGYPGGLWDMHVASGEIDYSPGYCRMLSYRSCDVPRTFAESLAFVHANDRAKVEEALAKHFDDVDHRFEVEYRMRTSNGDYHWFVSHGQAVFDADGKAERMVGFTRDITNRKRIARAISKSESDLREAQRIARLGSWRMEVETGEVSWSDQVFGMFGLEPGDKPPSYSEQQELFTEDSWELLSAHVRRVIEHGESYVLELETVLSDGSSRWVLARGECVRDPSGTIVGLQGTVQDITKSKTLEETLREQAVLIDQSPDGFVVRDLDHEIQFWSDGAERIYGISSDDALGKKIFELLQVDMEKFDEADREVKASGAWRGEFNFRLEDGSEQTIEARWKMLFDAEGEPRSILSVHTDFTDRKKMENQFLRAQRMESIGTLAGGIAHDLNNVLAPVLMGMAVLRRMVPDARAERIIDNVERSAKRGASLVKQVLSFARGIEGAHAPIKLHNITTEIESIVENTFPKSIEFRVELPEGVWLVMGDPTQLNQILLNLCVNARDAMPNGGSLRMNAINVEVDEQYATMNPDVTAGRYVVVEVADTGGGIPKEIIDRVFEPFFTTKEIDKGTGLGLSTVIGIVRSHGGFVNVYSEPGIGTTFKVYLPAADLDDVELDNASNPDALLHGDGEVVLLVDDEPSVLDVTQQTLEAFGYKVLVAEDGAQAIGVYAQHRADIAVIITDMMMPVMDGPALIAAVHRINPSAKIIAASGLSSGAKNGVSRVSALGVKHFLPKPYSADSLLQIMQVVINEPEHGNLAEHPK